MAIDKSKLKAVPAEMELVCYRCRTAPATLYRTMRTPNGSEYPRGWCEACLNGSGPARAKSLVGRKSKVDVSKLNLVPDGTALTCYRCKDQPAELCKTMRTPNGSKYLRGWCGDCLNGNGGRKRAKKKAPVGLPTFTITLNLEDKLRKRKLMAMLQDDNGAILSDLLGDLENLMDEHMSIVTALAKGIVQVEVSSDWELPAVDEKEPEECPN